MNLPLRDKRTDPRRHSRGSAGGIRFLGSQTFVRQHWIGINLQAKADPLLPKQMPWSRRRTPNPRA